MAGNEIGKWCVHGIFGQKKLYFVEGAVPVLLRKKNSSADSYGSPNQVLFITSRP
jgi:hypothetical protein